MTRNAVKVSAAATRRARAEAGRRAYEAEQRERARAEDRAKHDPFGSRVPDHSVVHRYARCLSYPEWGVGTVSGIYFSGEDDDIQQWARLLFAVGVRTVPAGSLQFVDFSKPDPAADRVQRFMTAAQHALAEGDAKLAAQRLVYARDAEPENPVVLRLLTVAFWQARNLPAAARTVRDWARVDSDRPTPERFASRIYEDMGAYDLAAEAAERAAGRAPADASAWERLGRLRLRLMDRDAAITALERARLIGPSVEGLLDLALAYHLAGDVGAEVSAAHAATAIEPDSLPDLVDLRARAGAHRPARRMRAGVPAGAGARQGPRGQRAARARRGGHAARRVTAQRRVVAPDALGRRDRALAPAHRAGLVRRQLPAAAGGAVGRRLEHAQQLTDPADEQPLLVDLDPGTRRGREDDVVAGLDRHPHADVIPPVEARADRQHDSLLRRRLVGAGGHQQAGAPDAVRIELLDHDAVEQRSQLAAHYVDHDKSRRGRH